MHEYAANRYLLRVERELGLLESLAHEGVVLSSLGHLALDPDLLFKGGFRREAK